MNLRKRLFLYVFFSVLTILVAYFLIVIFYLKHGAERKAKEYYADLYRGIVHTKKLLEESIPENPLKKLEVVLNHLKVERNLKLVIFYDREKVKKYVESFSQFVSDKYILGKYIIAGDFSPELAYDLISTEDYRVTGNPLKPLMLFSYPLTVDGEVIGKVVFMKTLDYNLAVVGGYLFLILIVPLINLAIATRILNKIIEEISFLTKLAGDFSRGEFSKIDLLRESIRRSKRRDEIYELKVAILKMVETLSKLLMQMEKEKIQYETLALTDPLTGLYNRRMFWEIATKELSKADRYGDYFSIIMLDIDYFKKINDTYGHDVGDMVIKKVAEILKKNVRSSDVVARWGGEEFIIMLPKTGLVDAVKVAEKLREIIEKTPIRLKDGRVIRITVSGGVSTFKGSESLEQLIREADMALYEAKRKGRNRVEIYKEMLSF